MHECCVVSEIGAVVKVVDSHLCGCGSIPSKSCSFSHSLLKQGLITVLHVLRSACEIPHASWIFLTSSLLLDYGVKQYIHTKCQSGIQIYKELTQTML